MTAKNQSRAISKVDAQGRLLIPAEIRERLGIKTGERLTLLVENDELLVLTFRAGIKRAQRIVAKYGIEKTMVDELIADRRAEAARE